MTVESNVSHSSGGRAANGDGVIIRTIEAQIGAGDVLRWYCHDVGMEYRFGFFKT